MSTIKNFLELKEKKDIWTLRQFNTVREALILMAEKNIGAVIIVDHDQYLIGIFSERDYARRIILEGKKSDDTKLYEVMTKDLITISQSHKIEQCMQIMTYNKIRHLPILEKNKLIGIISIGDVVKILLREQKILIDDLQNFIKN